MLSVCCVCGFANVHVVLMFMCADVQSAPRQVKKVQTWISTADVALAQAKKKGAVLPLALLLRTLGFPNASYKACTSI